MKPPTGRVRRTPLGADLIIKRTLPGSLEDVWTSITASESTARWFGPWEGDAGPGKTVRLQMAFEKDMPPCNVLIEVCEPPRHLVVSMKDDHGHWRLEATLASAGAATELTFVQHMDDAAQAADSGPGWEYYLDMLVAAHGRQPLPAFDDYYPSQRDHYLEEIRGQR
jgi:uncharacterized protein YndB with AHSA1/START domain